MVRWRNQKSPFFFLPCSFIFHWLSRCEMYANVSVCINAIKPNPLLAWHTVRVCLCELSGAVINWFSMSAGPRTPYRLQLLRWSMRSKNSPSSSVCMRSHSGYVCGSLPWGAVLWTRESCVQTVSRVRPPPNPALCCARAFPVFWCRMKDDKHSRQEV